MSASADRRAPERGTTTSATANPELVEAITTGMRSFDIATITSRPAPGQRCPRRLIAVCAPNLAKSSTARRREAIDIALKTARHATKRRKSSPSSSLPRSHRACLALVTTGFPLFLSDQPEEFVQVPFNGPRRDGLALGQRRRAP